MIHGGGGGRMHEPLLCGASSTAPSGDNGERHPRQLENTDVLANMF